MTFFYILRDKEERQVGTILFAAAAASLLLHGGVFFILKDIPIMTGVKIKPETAPPSLRLEFVDSPARLEKPKEEPLDTNLISDRVGRAQDVIPDDTDLTDSPRSVGSVPDKSIRKVPSGGEEDASEEAILARQESLAGRGTGIRKETVSAEQAGKQEEKRVDSGKGVIDRGGADKFLSPEAEDPAGKTRILKQVAYNTRSPAVGKYLARLKPRIVNLWHFKIINHLSHPRSRQTSVLFKIKPDGNLEKVTLNEHLGPPPEMILGLEAVAEAGPFPPLPIEVLEHIRDDGLWLEFTFKYY